MSKFNQNKIVSDIFRWSFTFILVLIIIGFIVKIAFEQPSLEQYHPNTKTLLYDFIMLNSNAIFILATNIINIIPILTVIVAVIGYLATKNVKGFFISFLLFSTLILSIVIAIFINKI